MEKWHFTIVNNNGRTQYSSRRKGVEPFNSKDEAKRAAIKIQISQPYMKGMRVLCTKAIDTLNHNQTVREFDLKVKEMIDQFRRSQRR